MWCSDFDDTLSTWDVDAPPLAIAAIHLSLLGMHLLAQYNIRVSKKSRNVDGIETWIPLIASRVRSIRSALATDTSKVLDHPVMCLCFPRVYLQSYEGWLQNERVKNTHLYDAMEKVLCIAEGYFRKHKPYAEMPISRHLFAAWAREDRLVESMLLIVEKGCSGCSGHADQFWGCGAGVQ